MDQHLERRKNLKPTNGHTLIIHPSHQFHKFLTFLFWWWADGGHHHHPLLTCIIYYPLGWRLHATWCSELEYKVHNFQVSRLLTMFTWKSYNRPSKTVFCETAKYPLTSSIQCILQPLTHHLTHQWTRPHLHSRAFPSPSTKHPKHCQMSVPPFTINCRTSQCHGLIIALFVVNCNKLLLYTTELYLPKDGFWNDN